MTDFKFLSIKAHPECDAKFLKNLTPGVEYEFYQDYSYTPGHQESEMQLELASQRVPENLYNITTLDGRELKVNISAIVGKNGTGKSSLIELLFAALYVFAVQTRTHKINKHSLENKLRRLQEKADQQLDDKIRETESELLKMQKIIDGLKCELKYAINGTVFKLDLHSKYDTGYYQSIPSVNTENVETGNFEFLKEDLLNHFFYTIAVNYSHYALNSRYIGSWIDELFQKNDGYKVPVVINPMRDEGNFNINTEMQLAKARLLTNVMIQRSNGSKDMLIYVTEKQFVEKITFTLNVEKLHKYFHMSENKVLGNARKTNMAIDIYQNMFPYNLESIFTNKSYLIQIAINYITHKVDRISENYESFKEGYKYGDDMNREENLAFLKKVLEEESHISYKIRRAVNFLHKLIINSYKDIFESGDHSNPRIMPVYEIPIEKLYQWMGSPTSQDVAALLPPSFFDVNFILNTDKSSSPSSFDSLSSGEMHFIHTIQSVIYHLNNLQSAHKSPFDRIKYRFVNIILDEIELYFHPDLQRKFVGEILLALKKLHRTSDIKIDGINILLLTHSPFILSDIPAQNVLLLETDEMTKKSMPRKSNYQTFAGNINEILTDSFFLEETLMGEFAEKEIEKFVENRKNVAANNDFLSIIGDTFLKSHIEEYLNG